MYKYKHIIRFGRHHYVIAIRGTLPPPRPQGDWIITHVSRSIGRDPPPTFYREIHINPPAIEDDMIHPTRLWDFKAEGTKYIVKRIVSVPQQRDESETWIMPIQRLPGTMPWPKKGTAPTPGPRYAWEEVQELRSRLFEEQKRCTRRR